MCLVDFVLFTGLWASPPNPGGETKNRFFFKIDFWMVFSWFWHRFWMTFLMIFQCFLYHFFDTFFPCFFEDVSHFFDFLLFGRTLADTHSTAAR